MTLRDLAKTYEARGWQQPALYLTQLLDGVRPTPAVSSAISKSTTPPPTSPRPVRLPSASIDSFACSRLSNSSRSRPKRIGNSSKRSRRHAGSSEPVIQSFGALLRRESTSGVRLTEEGFDGLTQLKQNVGLANQSSTASPR